MKVSGFGFQADFASRFHGRAVPVLRNRVLFLRDFATAPKHFTSASQSVVRFSISAKCCRCGVKFFALTPPVPEIAHLRPPSA
eukprot:3936112-Rhodomonas_salina.4